MHTLDTIHELALLLGLWHSLVTTYFPAGNMNDEQHSLFLQHAVYLDSGTFYVCVNWFFLDLQGLSDLPQTTAFSKGHHVFFFLF